MSPAPEYHTSSHCNAGACVEVAFQRSTFCSGGNCVEVAFHKSTYSNNGGCVEVSACTCDDSQVLVRDSKDKTGPVLAFTPNAWAEFMDEIRAGTFG